MLNNNLLVGALTIMSTLTANAAIKQADFGTTPDGARVSIFTLTNKNGLEARITNYGGIVVSLKTPDRKGAMGDVVLGFDNLAGYTSHRTIFFGALIGRYGNRIGHAQFKLDGVQYKVPANDGVNSLHGGNKGFDTKVWTPQVLRDGLKLTYVSKNGDEGYPGTLTVVVEYRLTDANELRIDYSATTDKPTVLNLTNHSYFNLKGSGDILGHQMMLNADRFTPVDSGLIPTGELKPVANTPFDFRKSTAIGARINNADEQLKLGKGYDHNWVLNKKGDELSLAARVEEPVSGRVLEVLTTQPGIQFYTGNFLDGAKGKGGATYPIRSGFCLETQHFPDSPNKPSFPSTVLRPGAQFKSTTVYRFSTVAASSPKK